MTHCWRIPFLGSGRVLFLRFREDARHLALKVGDYCRALNDDQCHGLVFRINLVQLARNILE